MRVLLVGLLGLVLASSPRQSEAGDLGRLWRSTARKVGAKVGDGFHRLGALVHLPKTARRARVEANRHAAATVDPTTATVPVAEHTTPAPTAASSQLGYYWKNSYTYGGEKTAAGQTFDIGNQTLLHVDAAVPHGWKKNRKVVLMGRLVTANGRPLVVEDSWRHWSIPGTVDVQHTKESPAHIGFGTGYPNRSLSAGAPPSYVNYPSAQRVRFEVALNPGETTLNLGAVHGQQITARVNVDSNGKVTLSGVQTEQTEAGLLMGGGRQPR